MMRIKIGERTETQNQNGFGEKYAVELVRPCSGIKILVFKEWMKDSHGFWFKKLMKGDGEIADGLSSWFIPYNNIRAIKVVKDTEPELTPDEEDQLGPIAVLKGRGKDRAWECSICKVTLDTEHLYYSVARKQHFSVNHECKTNGDLNG